jgi:hypothetical protein
VVVARIAIDFVRIVAGVRGQVLTAEEAQHHRAPAEERDRKVDGSWGATPPHRLVEARRTLEILHSERDEADVRQRDPQG